MKSNAKKQKILRIVASGLTMALTVTLVIGFLSQKAGNPNETKKLTTIESTAMTVSLTTVLLTTPIATTTTATNPASNNFTDPGNAAFVAYQVVAGKVTIKEIDSNYMAYISAQSLPVVLMIDSADSRDKASVAFFERLAIKYEGKAILLIGNVDKRSDLHQAFGFRSLPGFVRFDHGTMKATVSGYTVAKEPQIENLIELKPQG